MNRTAIYLSLLSSLLLSCNVADDFDNLTLELDTSMSLGTIRFDQESLFELSDIDPASVRYDAEGVMVLCDSVETDLIGDRHIEDILSVDFPPSTAPIVPGSALSDGRYGIGTTVEYRIHTPGSERLTEVTLQEGVVTFAPDHALDGVTCTVREISDRNGSPLVIAPGEEIDLSDGYVIRPSEGNILNLEYTGTVSSSASMEAEMTFSRMEIFSARGDFGRKEISITQASVRIDEGTRSFLANVEELYLTDPRIEIVLDNSFRIPVGIIVESLTSSGRTVQLKDGWGTTRHLTGHGLNVITIGNGSTVSGDGISQIINEDFEQVTVSIKAVINPTDADLMAPAGTVSSQIDNYYDRNCVLGSVIRFGIPLWGVFRNISYNDYYDADLSIRNIAFDNAIMAIAGTNTFPLSLSLDLYSVDEEQNERAITRNSIVIPSTSTNLPADRTVPMTLGQDNYLRIGLDAETLNDIGRMRKIRLRISATSLEADKKREVKIYQGSALDLRLSLGVVGSVNI